MVELLEDTQKKWRNAVQENNRLKLEIEHLEKTNSPKISENFENDESFLSANPSSLFSNECKKRRSSVFLRRSLSLPARNKSEDHDIDDDDDDDCYHSVNKRLKCSQKVASEDVLNDEVTLHCSKVSSSITTISGSENIKSSYDSKPHCFTLKRNFIRVNCGCCDCCIRFGVILAKCSRCKGTFHESCRNKAPLPCITRVETPKAYSNLKGRRLRLGDYCPDTRPMIPPLIAYCVHFLEKNSVTCDLYNNLGSNFEIESITKLFNNSRNYPKLEGFSPFSVASCIKKFLTEIREPVIPLSYGKEFISAAKSGNFDAFPKLVNDLPTAHMDTLACLCRHWKRFIEDHNINELSTTSFAERIASIVFGIQTISLDSQQHTIITEESAVLSLKILIDMPLLFWAEILNSRSSDSLRTYNLSFRNSSEITAIS